MKKSESPQPKAKELEICTVCGKAYRPAELVWVHGDLLCPLCLAENESCGCSD